MTEEKRVRLERLLSNRGYCSRKEVKDLIRSGAVLVEGMMPKGPEVLVLPRTVTVDGEPLDPGTGLTLMMHKPAGYTCSHKENGPLVYDLLPARYQMRRPILSTIGRLDKDTTGLLLFTDDGVLLHKLTSPKHKVPKVYRVTLESELRGDEKDIFASGTLIIPEEDTPLLPAELNVFSSKRVELTLIEGRYHQVKRMFEAVGNRVLTLHRTSFGPLDLGALREGEWRVLLQSELAQLA